MKLSVVKFVVIIETCSWGDGNEYFFHSSCAVRPSPALSTADLRERRVAYPLLPLASLGAHCNQFSSMAMRWLEGAVTSSRGADSMLDSSVDLKPRPWPMSFHLDEKGISFSQILGKSSSESGVWPEKDRAGENKHTTKHHKP